MLYKYNVSINSNEIFTEDKDWFPNISLLFNPCVFHSDSIREHKLKLWFCSVTMHSRQCIYSSIYICNLMWLRKIAPGHVARLICRARNNVYIYVSRVIRLAKIYRGPRDYRQVRWRDSLFSLLTRGRVRKAARLAGPLIVRYVYRSICVTFLPLYPLFASSSALPVAWLKGSIMRS